MCCGKADEVGLRGPEGAKVAQPFEQAVRVMHPLIGDGLL
jgi:hypothetical protein